MSGTDPAQTLTVEEAVPFLQSTPATLRSLLTSLPQGWIDFREDPEAWSPRMVLVHLIHNEQTNWIPRARIIRSSGSDHRFPPFQQMPDPGQIDDSDLAAMLADFGSLRRQNLLALQEFGLTGNNYQQTGEHPVLGTVTLGQLLATWVVHDLNHTHQILKSLAKLHAGAVGPWRPNLAILDL